MLTYKESRILFSMAIEKKRNEQTTVPSLFIITYFTPYFSIIKRTSFFRRNFVKNKHENNEEEKKSTSPKIITKFLFRNAAVFLHTKNYF